MENARIAGSNGIMVPAAGFGGSEVLSLTGDRTKSDREKIAILSNEFESLFLSRMLSSNSLERWRMQELPALTA